MPEIIVKAAENTFNEISALRDLFLRARQDTFNWVPPNSFKLLDFDKQTQGEYIMMAIYNEIIVGFISVWLEDSFIHHLYIDKKHYNKGIGTLLLKAVIDKIDLPIRLNCLESNEKAFEFYRKKGFIIKEKGSTEEGTHFLLELNKHIV